MAQMFVLTATYIAGLIFLGELMLQSTGALPLPSRFASLPAITLLFGPPTYLLGYISPYAAELATKDNLGEVSGRVYALGTTGSIVGAFATTYVLIPWLSINQIALLFGLVSVVTAVVLLSPDISKDRVISSGFITFLLIGAAGSGLAGISAQGYIVYETQTPYQRLEVTDRGDTRTLLLDGQRHSAMDLNNPQRHVFDYTRYFHLPLLLNDDIDACCSSMAGDLLGQNGSSATITLPLMSPR